MKIVSFAKLKRQIKKNPTPKSKEFAKLTKSKFGSTHNMGVTDENSSVFQN